MPFGLGRMAWWMRSSCCQSGSRAVQALDLVEVFGAIGQLVGAPGEQEHVFGCAQGQEAGVNLLQPEDDQTGGGALDVAAQVAGRSRRPPPPRAPGGPWRNKRARGSVARLRERAMCGTPRPGGYSCKKNPCRYTEKNLCCTGLPRQCGEEPSVSRPIRGFNPSYSGSALSAREENHAGTSDRPEGLARGTPGLRRRHRAAAAQRPGPGRHPVSHPPRRHGNPQEEAGNRPAGPGEDLAPEDRHRLVLPRLHRAGHRAPPAGRNRPGRLLPRPAPLSRAASTTRRSRRSTRPRRPATTPARCACSGPASTA